MRDDHDGRRYFRCSVHGPILLGLFLPNAKNVLQPGKVNMRHTREVPTQYTSLSLTIITQHSKQIYSNDTHSMI